MHHLAPRRRPRPGPHPLMIALLAALVALLSLLIGLMWHAAIAQAAARPCPPTPTSTGIRVAAYTEMAFGSRGRNRRWRQ